MWKRVEAEPLAEVAPEQKADPIILPQPMPEEPEPVPAPEVKETETQPLWGVKTNLLYAALLSPSIEVEHRFNPRWSGHFEFAIAWWKNKDKHKYYQLTQFSPEIRYWLNDKKFWKGHYIGAFLGAGHYDVENGARGDKGEYAMAGLSYGYMFPIGKHFSLETGIGVGYLITEYEEYLPIEGHYVYQQTSRTNYVGPVKAKLSLVWQTDWKWLKGGLR